MRNQTVDLAIVRLLMTDERPLQANFDHAAAAVLVSGIMLIERHPGIGEGFKRRAKAIRETIRQAIHAVAPDYADMLRDGYENDEDEQALKFIKSEGMLLVTFTVSDVWLIVSILQAVTRHPELPPDMLERIEKIGRQVQAKVAEIHPDANDLMEAGWDWDEDVVG